jgi:thiol-disulfide isomerase/thioredoxin
VLFILSLIAIFITLSVYCYLWYVKPKIDNIRQSDIPNTGGNNKEISIYFFIVDWCPHSNNAIPEWKQFCEKYNGQTINEYKINCIGGVNGTDCTNASDDPQINQLLQQFNIEHYPDIKLIKDTDIIEFDSKINFQNLENFVNNVLQSNLPTL